MITSEAPAAMGEVTSGNTRPDPDRLSRLILALVFVVALLPRLTGLITFDNADENPGASVRILTGELSGGASQTLPLINYLHAVSYCILYGAGRLIGVWHSVADFRAQYFQDKTPFIFAMRLLAACWGALSAPVACTIGRRLGLSKSGAITLGLMVALLPVNVWLSHVAKPDSAVATALLLVAWSLLY